MLKSIGTTPEKIADSNLKRKLIVFTNTHATQLVYLSDEPDPDANSAKWYLAAAGGTLKISRIDGYPERPFYALGSGASTTLYVGEQFDPEDPNK